MLTAAQLEHIEQCLAIAERNLSPADAPKKTMTDWYHCHVKALLNELERVADQLTDAWLVLDGIAREAGDPNAATCAVLLRRQQVPGWRPNEIKSLITAPLPAAHPIWARLIPRDRNFPAGAVQCDACGGRGCVHCEGRGWYADSSHARGRHCARHGCNKPLAPDHLAVYCSNPCAAADA